MKKITIFIIAVLLSVGAYATGDIAGTGNAGQALTKKEQRRTLRGFRCYIDAGYIFRLKKHKTITFFWAENSYPVSSNLFANATVGYQFNNFFFLGGGVGISYLTHTERIGFPLYVDMRVNILNKKYSPFVDVKVGKALGIDNDIYGSLSVGVKVMLKNKMAMNFGVEASSFATIWGSETDDSSGVGLKIGFEI